MKRIFLFIAILFFTGIYAWYVTTAALVTIVIALTLYIIFHLIKGRYKLVICSILVPIAGFSFISFKYSTTEKNASLYYDTKTSVLAKVVNTYCETDYAFIDILLYETDNKILSDKVLARIYADKCTLIRGDIISANIKLFEPSIGNNIGDINTKLSRVSIGIGLSGNFADDNIKVIKNEFSYFSPLDIGYKIKTLVSKRIDKYFRGFDKGIAKALLLGDKSDIPKIIYGAFKISGMSHMIAVSGMHINIIMALITGFFALLGMGRSKIAILISLIMMWVFIFVTGCVLSSVRAGIMSSILLSSFLTKKSNDSLNSLGVAVLLILIISPSSAFDAGFMLSVSATFSILVFAKPIKNKLKFLPNVLGDILSIVLAVQIVTMPALTYMSGTVPLFGIIPNILICPLLPLIMIMCILGVVFAGIPFFGTVFIWAIQILTNGMSTVALLVSRVPCALVILGKPDILRIMAYSAVCFAIYNLLIGLKSKTRIYTAVAMSIYATIFMCFIFSQIASFTFLNVQHGDCMLFRNNKITVMFDSGGSKFSDVAENIVIPYLNKQGINKIDIAFITHYHSDHCESYLKLIKYGRVRRLVMPQNVCDAEIKTQLLIAAKTNKTKVYFVKGGEQLAFGGLGISTFNTYRNDDINNGIIYTVSYGKCSVCITGDINKEGELRAVPFVAANKCDILKVSHHGSSSSTSSTFLKAVSASCAVISASVNDKIGEETRQELKDNLNIVYETSVNGTIGFKMNKEEFLSVNLMKNRN